jgi:DNA-binding PadR family transcriptional regulator
MLGKTAEGERVSHESAGELERLVMLAILRLGDAAYGAAIMDELERRTGRAAGGAVYVALKRLERKGFISSRLGPSTPERGGRAKRLVRLEPAGLDHVREVHAEWRRMTDGLGSFLEEA